jgi:peptidoglycan glycosyltransferase
MDKRIRITALFIICCFGLLVLQLNNLQVRQSGSLDHSQYQATAQGANWYSTPRGDIVSSDGHILAESIKTKEGYVRVYPYGSLFADVTGYFDAVQESDQYGIEAQYNNFLVQHESTGSGLKGLLTETKSTDLVQVTVSVALQRVAEQALGGYLGAIVAFSPTTGAILAMYSNPTYDPNKLSLLDGKAVQQYYDQAAKNRPNPTWGGALLNDVTGYPIAPGSTFKVITTATVYDHDPSLASFDAAPASAISITGTDLLFHNYGGETCGGPIAVILAQSCDTAYAELGEKLGAQRLFQEATAFGFDSPPPIDLPPGEIAPANFPNAASFADNQPAVAYSAIGQQDVTETALQDVLVAGAVADDGTMMTPHLMGNIVSQTGQLIRQYKATPWRQATSKTTADKVLSLMTGVTSAALRGTAAGLFPPGLTVAAKTGTAETGGGNCSADWLIATAPAGAGQTPSVAVAAVLPYQPGLTCSDTGAEAAGPRVAAVLEAALDSSSENQ